MVKTIRSLFAIGLAGSLSLGLWSARADLEVSASFSVHAAADFYAPLTPHGAWIEVGSYGRCWRPTGVTIEWRPYCYGHWVWTDCGWYWESDEPWAWACYHYGSWVYDPVYAWVWVPGIEWAPAWVSWRVGGGYIGWAPLPPRGVSVTIAPARFVFVETTRFHGPVRPSTVIVNNTTVLNRTTVINNIKRETRTIEGAGPRKVVVNEGPGLDMVQKSTGRKFKPVPIQEAVRQTPLPPALSHGRQGEPRSTAHPGSALSEVSKSHKFTEPKGKDQPAITPSETTRSHETREPKGREKSSFAPVEPSKPASPREFSPSGRPAPPQERPNAPYVGQHKPQTHGKEKVLPSPERPPTQAPDSPNESGESRGHEKEHEGHGKGRPG